MKWDLLSFERTMDFLNPSQLLRLNSCVSICVKMRAALSECLVQDCHMPHTMSEQSPHGAATSLMSTEAINQTIKAAGGASG